MNSVAKAIKLAVKAHENQLDKGGNPYILHPLRVMLQMENETEMIAAVLHDVVEDTNIGLDDLRAAGLPEAAIKAIDCLTKHHGEDYEVFIRRVQTNPIAIKVKIADLEDNMNITRIPRISPQDLERLAKYHRALGRLRMKS